MKKSLIALLLLVATALGISLVSYAAGITHPKQQSTVQAVTVAVDGFTCQMCPDQLQQDLAKLPGVTDVKATLDPAQVTAKLDESQTTVSQFIHAIATHKTAMDDKATYGAHLLVYVDTQACAKQKAMCEGCNTEISARLKTVKGIDAVTFDAAGKIVSITFRPDAQIKTTDIAKALQASSFHFTVGFTAPATATQDTKQQHTQSMDGACH